MSAIAPAHSPERSPFLRKGRKGLVMMKSAHPQVLSAVSGSVFSPGVVGAGSIIPAW